MALNFVVPGRHCSALHRCRPHVCHCDSGHHGKCASRTQFGKAVVQPKHREVLQPAPFSRSDTNLGCVSEHANEGQVAESALQSAPAISGSEHIQESTQAAHQAVSVYQPASLSRVFIGVQPGRGLARQVTKVGKPSGPMSLMLLLFTLAGTISAAVRQRFEAAARECTTCHGFGINRCTLCSGTGAVGWEGKWNHKEPCPMCLGKRFVDCPECGGHFHRRIFSHHQHSGLTVTELVEAEQTPVSKLGD